MRNKFLSLLTATIATFCAVTVSPAEIISDGTVELAFDAGGFTNGEVTASRLQPDGKVIIGGAFTRVHGVNRSNLARLNPDGTLDESFVPWSQIGRVSEIELLPDNRLLVSATFFSGEPFGFYEPLIARLNSDGSVDPNFTAGQRIARTVGDDNGRATDKGYVYGILVQADGKIVVVGDFAYVYTGPGTYVPRSGVVRFNSDGTLDATFNPGTGAAQSTGGFPGFVSMVALQKVGSNSGKLILFGYFDSFDGQPANEWVRLNGNGTVDSTFAVPATVPLPDGIAVQADDYVIIYGVARSAGAPAIARLQPNGATDPGFNPPGDWRGSDGVVATVVQQPDGKLLVAGSFRSIANVAANDVIRLQTDGTRDPSFDATVATGPYARVVQTLLVHPENGRIFVGGDFSTYGGAARNNFAWVNPDGSVAPTFAGLSGATDRDPSVEGIAVQPDGKIVVVGNFTSVNGSPRYGIVRLNPDLTIDQSFSPLAGVEGTPTVVLLQPDGKILIGGYRLPLFIFPPGILARFNADGSPDTSFDPGTGADGFIAGLAQDDAGNIFVAGGFGSFDGQPRRRVAKLSPSGAVDPTFDPGVGADRSVDRIVFAPEANAVIIGGQLLNYQGVPVGHIARLNANTAALDTSFNAGGSGFDSPVRGLLRDPNGKYYASTTFARYNNVDPGSGVFRLNSDGTRDQSFSTGAQFVSDHPIALQGDRVYLARETARVARFTSTGAFDSGFNTPAGGAFSDTHQFSAFGPPRIASLAIQPDGKLLVGGAFTTFNNSPRVCLVRLTDSELNFTAVSRKMHGDGGPVLDLNVALAGAPAIESRSGGASGAHQLIFNFAGPVTVGSATLSSGNGTVSNFSGSGTSTITVNLTDVANAQRITLQLGNVSTGTSVIDVPVTLGMLIGDSNGDRNVNAGDAFQTRSRSGQPATPSNYRSDVNADGTINTGDAILVRSRSGQSLP